MTWTAFAKSLSACGKTQKDFETPVLEAGSNAGSRAMALRLVSLYHWAKASELLAKYMLQGEPTGINALITKHFDSAIKSATEATDSQLEMLMRWLHAASTQMVAGSIWRVARAVNSRVTKFVHEVTKQQGLFELLPPQRAAWLEQGLLDQAATAVVIDMPTSGGKTLLAQFRILQALNQFDAEHGWVACGPDPGVDRADYTPLAPGLQPDWREGGGTDRRSRG